MSKTEIIAELAHLSPQDLADVRAWLDRQLTSFEPVAMSRVADSKAARLRSPRLADRARAVDLIKHVTELSADAPV